MIDENDPGSIKYGDYIIHFRLSAYGGVMWSVSKYGVMRQGYLYAETREKAKLAAFRFIHRWELNQEA